MTSLKLQLTGTGVAIVSATFIAMWAVTQLFLSPGQPWHATVAGVLTGLAVGGSFGWSAADMLFHAAIGRLNPWIRPLMYLSALMAAVAVLAVVGWLVTSLYVGVAIAVELAAARLRNEVTCNDY